MFGNNIKNKLKWAKRVARMNEKRNVWNVLVGKLKERDHLEDLGVDWKNINVDLKRSRRMCTGLIWFIIKTSGGML
jgi:hypothetical protein